MQYIHDIQVYSGDQIWKLWLLFSEPQKGTIPMVDSWRVLGHENISM